MGLPEGIQEVNNMQDIKYYASEDVVGYGLGSSSDDDVDEGTKTSDNGAFPKWHSAVLQYSRVQYSK